MQNVEDYLNEVLRLIRENFYSTDPTGGMPAAVAAYLVQRSLGYDQSRYGFFKFKEVLARLEERGLLKTGFNSKNAFSIWLTGRPGQSVRQVIPPVPAQRFRRLRKEIWFAFVSVTHGGRRFFNRNTGEVRTDAQGWLDKDPNWVEIVPFDPATERRQALEFLKENNIDSADYTGSINSDHWYTEFPKALSARSLALSASWKRYRSQSIIEVVKGWGQKHGIDEQLLFDDFRSQQSVAGPQGAPRERNQLKKLLLTVLERMSADELMKLNLPVSHLVAVLRPDLLDS